MACSTSIGEFFSEGNVCQLGSELQKEDFLDFLKSGFYGGCSTIVNTEKAQRLLEIAKKFQTFHFYQHLQYIIQKKVLIQYIPENPLKQHV
jgi:hypothetical protein